jgi:heme exporter protein D
MMTGVLSQGVNAAYVWLAIGAAVVSIVSFLYALIGRPLRKWLRERRHEDDWRLQRIHVHDRVLFGAKPTEEDPDPPPGLVAQFRALHRRLTPNGGETRDPGDLLIRIARQVGVPVNSLGPATGVTEADKPNGDSEEFEEPIAPPPAPSRRRKKEATP